MTSIFDTFFDKAKDVADAATKKTGELVEMSKYKLESVKINNEIEKIYQRLGASVYSMIKGGYDNQELVEGLTEEIDELLMRLEAVNIKINDMKNVSICSVCGAKNEADNYYCSKCGSRIKTEFTSEPEPEPDCTADPDCDTCDAQKEQE